MKKLLFLLLITFLFLAHCTEDDVLLNPYDGIEYGQTTAVIDTLSATSFVKIHRDILLPSCSDIVVGCHDGTFPPDFRTVESAYNTLVYTKVIKNNEDETFTYRVVPGDTANSVLHERLTNCCFVNTNDRMPQNNIGSSLPQEDLDNIANWILEGARDISGNAPATLIDTPPWVFWYVVANSPPYNYIYSEWGHSMVDSDTSFSIPSDEEIHFMFRVKDEGYNQIIARDVQINILSISEDKDDFSNPIATYQADFVVKDSLILRDEIETIIPEFGGTLWVAELNTDILQSGTLYFMRYTISDGYNEPVEFPNYESAELIKTNWSFTVN
ncbi:MAG: hypothetical protein VX762_01175 [Bacteroidota bacterium]|nr:hypothetical protein [Bacteroidota bacterium]MEC9209019.1 hypothetical protein [Bacteroidota bacterium]